MVVERAPTIQANAERADELDLAAGFAQAALDLNYVRPTLDTSTCLDIVNGRHPSVEAGLLAQARAFTPNSTHMGPEASMHVITGPNQGGKSTLLRQTAVIAILAQAGSFVPADAARIGVVDRVFSRVGARDDLFRDRSTFMLEMVETAAILRAATPRSLVIMDEIGRGTTLHAGMAIAYATLDYILSHVGCRTLFATHYHELARMLGAGTSLRPGVAFFCTDVEEGGGAFAYAYRLRPGINYNSHAIMAAQLAGMPEGFLEVARRTLADLEGEGREVENGEGVAARG
jgi:DNA mismatch repair ATPase MutS